MKLTIGQKILAGYGLALVSVAIIGFWAYRSTQRFAENAGWVTHTYQALAEANKIRMKLADAESGARGFVLTGADRDLEHFDGVASLAESRKALRELTADNPVQQRRVDAIGPLLDRKFAFLQGAIDERRRTGLSGGVRMLEIPRGQEFTVEIRSILAALEDEEQGLLRQRSQEAKAGAESATGGILLASLLGLAVVTAMGLAIRRSLTLLMAEFQTFVTAVGEGDLSLRSAFSGGEDMGTLALGLNRMVAGLREMAMQTRGVTENLTSATAEILASAKQQAAGTGEQAAACQETNTTMQQVSSSVAQIAERAKQLAATAEALSASTGMEAVQKTNQTVETIRQQADAVAENIVLLSQKTATVGEIIATVNDIAEQSHLLALNAAIEAAAAGEHGRSFAVVAGEIKHLADQSKEATVQVKSILGDIQNGINRSVMLTEEAVKRVDLGKQQADEAASTIREMTANIQQSVEAFQQIVAGANQQQIGFEHVMQAVKDIGRAADQTATSTRQTEKAAANLTSLGQQLRKVTDRYRI